jgi:Winged helix DNA-binding domain
VNVRELRARRAAAQLLSGPRPAKAVDVVHRLLAVQAQDLHAARLAIRARSTGLTAADVDRELEERSLVVGWLLRGTLHLVCADDYRWLLALTAPTRLAANRRRLRQEGVSPAEAEQAVAIVESALADEGPLTRPELAERLAVRGIRTEGQATLLMLAALRGAVVLGPPREGRQAFVRAEDWLGPEHAVDREAALAELARRYLTGHRPALRKDLARWAGLPLRDVRLGPAAATDRLEAPADPPPRLLPAFDPYLLGWKDRTFAVPAEHARSVHPGGGVLRPVATVGGLAVGTWRRRRSDVELDMFAAVRPEDKAALEAEAADVARFEGTSSKSS